MVRLRDAAWVLVLAAGCAAPAPVPAPEPGSTPTSAAGPRPAPLAEPDAGPSSDAASSPRTELEKNPSGWIRRDDPEGPLLRVTSAVVRGPKSGAALRDRALAVLPALHDCYVELLGRTPDASGEIGLAVDLVPGGPRKSRAEHFGDAAFQSCAAGAFERLDWPEPEQELGLRMQVALYPRALSAPELAEHDGPLERWEADASCWYLQKYPCAPNKSCMAPELVRVRCSGP